MQIYGKSSEYAVEARKKAECFFFFGGSADMLGTYAVFFRWRNKTVVILESRHSRKNKKTKEIDLSLFWYIFLYWFHKLFHLLFQLCL